MEFRRIQMPLIGDLADRKMVFVAGPRQCGKTTIAQRIAAAEQGRYYNWDIPADRRLLVQRELATSSFWVFDELHKYRQWRNWLKGVYDEHHQQKKILVTGSARLDLYGRGGDSLQGRYFLHRMHPLTLSEVLGVAPDSSLESFADAPGSQEVLSALLRLGGFPEPFLSGSQTKADRWRLGYGSRLVREEVRSLEATVDLDRMELLYERLPQTVGSVLSMNALREDLEVAFGTVKKWIIILEKLYGVFRVAPFGPAKIKAVKKEQKLYFWDWSRVENEAARLENLVALHLLRYAHWLEDTEGKRAELRYFRTANGHEVDFVLLIKNKPELCVEVKSSDGDLDTNLRYFLERVKVPRAFQIALHGRADHLLPSINGSIVRKMPAAKFLCALP